jgi:hypothetical protein
MDCVITSPFPTFLSFGNIRIVECTTRERSEDSVVGIATGYGLAGCGVKFESQ